MTDAVAVRAPFTERWLALAAWVVLCGGGVLIVSGWDWLVPPCVFHEFTGLWCPGCGSGRALAALSRLHLGAAMSANPLVTLGLPFLLFGLVRETAASWGLIRPLRRSVRTLPMVLLILIAGFWILRNLPGWPFELLAPR